MDLESIRHVATLAELSLSEEEEKRMAEEVGRILAYVKELEALDTTDLPPTAPVVPAGFAAPKSLDGWRDDATLPGLTHEEALANAPRVEHDGFAVPSFVE